jgi:hypothetical protein
VQFHLQKLLLDVWKRQNKTVTSPHQGVARFRNCRMLEIPSFLFLKALIMEKQISAVCRIEARDIQK